MESTFQTITDPQDIKHYHSIFIKKLIDNLPQRGNFNIGFPGGSWGDEEVHYNNEIWLSHYEITDSKTSPRYWNGFGLSQNLSEKYSNDIVVEINIPTNGVNRRVAGFLARNDSGELGIFHRGGLGGGRKGVGKQAFLNWSSYELTSVITEGKREKAIFIDTVESPSFMSSLYQFLENVNSFKKAVTSGEIDEASFLSNDDLLEKIKNDNPRRKKPRRLEAAASEFERSVFVKEYALRAANGICQLCEKEGPFKTKRGRSFLEVHHIAWLSKGGLDLPDNVIGLCPNCHRKMHMVNNKKDVKKIRERALELLKVSEKGHFNRD